MNNHRKYNLATATLVFVVLFSLILPFYSQAQEIVPDKIVTMEAKATEILIDEMRTVQGTDTKTRYQKIKALVLDGPEKGSIITIENDYIPYNVGDVFYITHTTNNLDGMNMYSVPEPYRLSQLEYLGLLFVLLVIMFGGKQGMRGLVSLVGSFLFIFLILLPLIIKGYSPVLVSIGVCSLVIVLGSYITHGFNRTTSSAVIGMIVTVLFTGLLAYVSIGYTKLSGFASDESVYLNFNTNGHIDFAGLLLGGILIGLLGVLYDAAIGQAISVEELHRVGPHLSRRFIYTRALRIGREHIGALVNTLAIAYVGVSLPLLLLFYGSAGPITTIINREVFATEIVRILIGSIGLVLAVPITTLISVSMIVHPKNNEGDEAKLKEEAHKLEHIGHSH